MLGSFPPALQNFIWSRNNDDFLSCIDITRVLYLPILLILIYYPYSRYTLPWGALVGRDLGALPSDGPFSVFMRYCTLTSYYLLL